MKTKHQATARIRAINYHINRNQRHLSQPELEKLIAEKGELEKVIKAQK
jgi:hypothetical protein